MEYVISPKPKASPKLIVYDPLSTDDVQYDDYEFYR